MKTQKKDLRSGMTVWQARTPDVPLTSSKTLLPFYDAIVVGAGISGALAAHALCDGKRSVLVVDRRIPTTGSTSASTALILWEVDVPLRELAKKVGRKRAVAAYLANHKAVQSLARLISKEKIDCDLRRRDTLLLAGDQMDAKALKSETGLRKRIGLPSAFLTSNALLAKYGFEREGAILSAASLEIDPRKLAIELLSRAGARGATLAFPRNVVKMDASNSGAFITLDTGQVIATRKLVAATGYETLPEIPKSKYQLSSTWALATIPQPPEALWPTRALVWEASDPYLYFRTTLDNRIIVGGEDAAFTDPDRRDAMIEKKSARILAKLGKMLPGALLQADYKWAGTFAESPTGLPVLASLPGAAAVFVILGAGGNGITYSAIASDMVKAWADGKPTALESVFGL